MKRLAVLILSAVAVGPAAPAQQLEFDEAYRRVLAQNPPQVTFEIRFSSGSNIFRQGEKIVLELLFSSTSGDYELSTRNYDRSGRLGVERYHVDPAEHTADPLRDYFLSGLGFLGGGLSGIAKVGPEPKVLHFELNEWVRFDRPGRYRLYVESKRLTNRARTGSAFDPIGLASNLLELEIVAPDREWQEATLAGVLEVLDRPSSGQFDDAARDQRIAACRTLRFLGTREAVEELARRVSRSDTYCEASYRFGLFGSPMRREAVAILHARLLASEEPVSPDLLWTLAMLTTLERWGPLPAYPAGDPAAIETWQQNARDYDRKRREVHLDLANQLENALVYKKPASRLESLYTLFQALGIARSSGLSAGLTGRSEAALRELIISFREIPQRLQHILLETYWPSVRRQELLPALRELLQTESGTSPFRDLVLQRLMELSPEEGRSLLLDAIRSGHPAFGLAALRSLPDETLPDLDMHLAEQLEQALTPEGSLDRQSMSAALVERYATPAILYRVHSLYAPQAGMWPCATQTPLLAYFLRVAPELGVREIERAMQLRGPNHSACHRQTLTGIANLRETFSLDPIAIAHLSDPDAETDADAIRALQKSPDPRIKDVLWKAFRDFGSEWKQRIPGLTDPATREHISWSHSGVEYAFWQAIFYGPAWIVRRQEFDELVGFCVTPTCRMGLLSNTRNVTQPNLTYVDNNGMRRWMVGQYEFDSLKDVHRKLSDYPAGSLFCWVMGANTDAQRGKTFEEFRSFLQSQQKDLQLLGEGACR